MINEIFLLDTSIAAITLVLLIQDNISQIKWMSSPISGICHYCTVMQCQSKKVYTWNQSIQNVLKQNW